jgi:hypothetical protein
MGFQPLLMTSNMPPTAVHLEGALPCATLALRLHMLLLLFCCRRTAAILLLVQGASQHCKLALGQGAEGEANQLPLQLLAAGHCMTATTYTLENSARKWQDTAQRQSSVETRRSHSINAHSVAPY